MEIVRCTAKAPVNIAVIKYWGKRDEELILPINDSISATLSMEQMCATTTVACSSSFKQDRMWLNGKEQDINNPRLQNCLRKIRQLAGESGDSSLKWPVHICSKNNFPTAAGLASSAAGYACLVFALGSLYGVKEELSILARQGSGSACRSIYSGFVQWEMGTQTDGSDSIAKQIVPQNHWPEMRIIILVVNAEKKEVSSTSGMKDSVETSDLIGYRASTVVPKRVNDIKAAILNRDFDKFAEITMKDSNQFHAICLDTFPPIRYMNATSFAIVDLIHQYNKFYGTNKVAYTFDAGPNACLFLLEPNVPEIIALIQEYFPSSQTDQYIKGIPVAPSKLSEDLRRSIKLEPKVDSLQFIINTQVGEGPVIITDPSKQLLDEQGLPK